MDYNKMAQEAMVLVNSGMTMEGAMAKVLKENAPKTVGKVDRVALAGELDNIEDLERRRKIAFAKKSKSVNSKDPDKYQPEIQAISDRLNYLKGLVYGAEDRVAKAVELGMSTSSIIQMYILDKSKDLDTRMDAIPGSKKSIRLLLNTLEATTPQSILDDLNRYNSSLALHYIDQVKHNNQLVISINRKTRLLDNTTLLKTK